MPQLPSTDLINRLQTRAPSETRALEEIAQPSRDQDVKIKACVGRIQRVLDDAVFATKARIATHSQTRSHTTTITESLDLKLPDEVKTTR